MYMYTCVYIYVQVHIYIYMCTCVCVYIYVYKLIYIYIYIYTCMYVHGTIPAAAIRLQGVSGAPSSSVPNLWELHLRGQSWAHSVWGLGV